MDKLQKVSFSLGEYHRIFRSFKVYRGDDRRRNLISRFGNPGRVPRTLEKFQDEFRVGGRGRNVWSTHATVSYLKATTS